jgi:hypothetical protein
MWAVTKFEFSKKFEIQSTITYLTSTSGPVLFFAIIWIVTVESFPWLLADDYEAGIAPRLAADKTLEEAFAEPVLSPTWRTKASCSS